ncbi:MAG: NADH-quinone oxidoreductase subunit C [Propionibacteriaceae bacterium]|nr:NADH-quinone oxidoreductase subunit C [Propionibacteriaceae bacterium]
MEQEIIDIEAADLLSKTADMKNAGYRLAQACATANSDAMTLHYSFAKDAELVTLRFSIADSITVESIGWLYPYAFLYENEMKDLFGLSFSNMNLDFKGNFYQTAIKTPFNPKECCASGTESDAVITETDSANKESDVEA